MEESRLASGELVVYVDSDQIQWGPWKVVRTLNGEIIVLVDGLVEESIPRSCVRKAGEGTEESYF